MKLAPIIPIRRNELPPEKNGWAWELKLVQDAGGSGMVGRRERRGVAGATVVNLMNALRRSVQTGRPAPKKGNAAEKVGRQSGSGRRVKSQ